MTARLAAEADVATLRAIVDAAEEAILGVDRDGDDPVLQPVRRAPVRLARRRDHRAARQRSLIADHEQHLLAGVRRRRWWPARPCAAKASRGAATARTSRPSSTPARSWARTAACSGTALIVLDISARRRTQRMLERIIEHAPNVIAVKDLDGRYLVFSALGAAVRPAARRGASSGAPIATSVARVRRAARGSRTVEVLAAGPADRRSRTPGARATAGR